MATDFRPTIIAALERLAANEKAAKNAFKARAYNKVLDQIRARGDAPIHALDDLKTVTGIGESIRGKLEEIFATGALALATPPQENKLMEIYGIGQAKMHELVAAGIHTVAELRAAVAKNTGLLNEKQKIGLKYYEALLERIPRAEMNLHAGIIGAAVTPGAEFEIVGSYRRGAANSGDIDVLVRNGVVYIDDLKRSGYILETLAEGPKKFMGIVALPNGTPRRLDILLTPDEEYPFALLYFTGSQKFNIQMRQKALELGYTLNEHRLAPLEAEAVAAAPRMRNERDIFKFLKMKWVKPTARE